MGEIADMMLEGFMDEETGEIIDGDSPGVSSPDVRYRSDVRERPSDAPDRSGNAP